MSYNTDLVEFQKSLSMELESIQNRVRFLIGNSHWGEEGRYKEAILKNILVKYLPNNIGVGTGFIIKNDGMEIKRSSQIDIIIYRSDYPILFKEGDFIVTTPEAVLGIIEVKTRLNSSTLKSAITKAEENSNFIPPKKYNSEFEVFNGIFSYEWSPENQSIFNSIKDTFTIDHCSVNHICLGKNGFIRKFNKDKCYNLYNLDNLSVAYFIYNLIETATFLANGHDTKDMNWALFPLPEGKDRHKIQQIPISQR